MSAQNVMTECLRRMQEEASRLGVRAEKKSDRAGCKNARTESNKSDKKVKTTILCMRPATPLLPSATAISYFLPLSLIHARFDAALVRIQMNLRSR